MRVWRFYCQQLAAYQRTFDRFQLSTSSISAMAGAMGGSVSEGVLPVRVAEDTFVRCKSAAMRPTSRP